MNIRSYRPADLPHLYRICLATAAAGRDAASLYRDPLLVGHVYMAPYAILSPDTCLVVEDGNGVCGYIVGARDTETFESQLEIEWWPDLRRLYSAPRQQETGPEYDDLMVRLIHRPFHTPRRFSSAYPSHLHINLLPRMQGKGCGRALMTRWLGRLWDMESIGAHLAVGTANPRAVAFYRQYGFDEIERTGKDKRIAWFGLRR